MPLVKARPLLVYTVPDFWWCILANGFFPLTCLQCAIALDVWVLGAVMQVLNGSFKEEVVQLGGLNWHLGSRNVYSSVWAGHCHALEGRNDALRERELEGKATVSAEMLTEGSPALWWDAKPGSPLLSLAGSVVGPSMIVYNLWHRKVEEAWVSLHASL